MNCELCGKETEMYKALVEGTELSVCMACSKYGKVTGKVREYPLEGTMKKAEEPSEGRIESVVGNLGGLLKKKREELGLNHADFAKKIAEKESILRKLETGAIKPTLSRARALEKLLGLKLVEEIEEEQTPQKKNRDVLTLGDLLKIKARESK